MMIFRHYRDSYRRIWTGGYMYSGPRGNWIVHPFKCRDCRPKGKQWFGWRWWGLPGRGPFLGPFKDRKHLIEAINLRERPALSVVPREVG